MGYQLSLSESAERTFTALPPYVRACAHRELQKLAQDPLRLSRPACFPHALDGQMFDITIREGAIEHYLTVNFHFRAEQWLDISWIIHIQREL